MSKSKSIKFEEGITINSPRQVVFNYTQDYNNRLKWDTFLKKADLINGADRAGTGVMAYCVTAMDLGFTRNMFPFILQKLPQ